MKGNYLCWPITTFMTSISVARHSEIHEFRLAYDPLFEAKEEKCSVAIGPFFVKP